LPPLIPLVPKPRQTSAARADCARAPQQPRQSLDRVPTPGGKRRRHDRRPPPPDCLRPDVTHTHLSKKDRKLLDPAFRLTSVRWIRLAKASLATHPQFPVKPRSQPLRHL